MATAPLKRIKPADERDIVPAVEAACVRFPGRGTSHLKLVPETRVLREQLRAAAKRVAGDLDKTYPLSKNQTETLSRQILAELQLPEGYLGWTMVMLTSAFWYDQISAVPVERRLLLLPPVLAHAPDCNWTRHARNGAATSQAAVACPACALTQLRSVAHERGYQVVSAEGTASVMRQIMAGNVDALIGVASLSMLEKAIDKILLTGIPCQALPLLGESIEHVAGELSVDADWLAEMISTPYRPGAGHTRSYIHIMRAAARLFSPARLERLAPRLHSTNGGGHGSLKAGQLEPISGTESIALDFLAKGGKHSRPFITLAVHDALTGGHATQPGGAEHLERLPDAVFRAALSIETFHKASLVHDDIEDDDQFRYGDETLHRKFGMATAINVGDYLIGLGYRLVSRETASLGPEVAADILDRLAEAHMKLSEGQGAELLWRDSHDKAVTPRDALNIYALKTAPAFEAALHAGLRLACPSEPYRDTISRFARHLGVAFQILNDLNDWDGDDHNKLLADGDIVGGRPTLLWALALEGLAPPERAELQRLASEQPLTAESLARIKELYQQAGVFDQAARLVNKYQEQARAVAASVEPAELRRLLAFLIEMVLDRQSRTSGASTP